MSQLPPISPCALCGSTSQFDGWVEGRGLRLECGCGQKGLVGAELCSKDPIVEKHGRDDVGLLERLAWNRQQLALSTFPLGVTVETVDTTDPSNAPEDFGGQY